MLERNFKARGQGRSPRSPLNGDLNDEMTVATQQYKERTF